ncbi:MAG: GAF domain-containing protein, partial [Anaerolineae bacterium]
MDILDTLIPIALDLTAALNTGDRYQRLLATLAKAIPYDAAALLRLEGGVLVPVAARGLAPEALGRRYPLREHPRLDIICKADAPVRFPADNALPDPFEGMLADDEDFVHHIHACLGCPLHADGRLIGALTADAVDPKAFDRLDQRFLTAVGALAGVQLQTAGLMDTLEHRAERQGQIASDLMADIFTRRGPQLLGDSAAM